MTRTRLGGIAVLACLLATVLPAAAQAAPQWHDGNQRQSFITNCPSIIFGNPYTEVGASSYTGFYADANDLPDVGETFYVHVVFVALGNACSGQYGYPEVAPPPGTQFAIDGAHPVFCYALDFNQSPPTAARNTQECPQQPQSPAYGGAGGFGPVNTDQPAWPMPQGRGWEIQVPVVATQPLRGTLNSPCHCVVTPTKILDGNSSPVLRPEAGVVIEPAPPADPGTGGGDTGGGAPGDGQSGGNPGTPADPMMPEGSTSHPMAMPHNPDPHGMGPMAADAPALGTLAAPARARIRSVLRRGLPLVITVGQSGSTVTAVLRERRGRRSTVLASLTRRGADAGELRLRLEPSRSGERRLRRARRVRASLVVTVRPPGGGRQIATREITLRR